MKREEIVEGMAIEIYKDYIGGNAAPWESRERGLQDLFRSEAEAALAWLESQGIVEVGG